MPDQKLRFDDRVVIVTGAGRGMGFAHASLLAQRGARVVVNDVGAATLTGGSTSTDIAEHAAAELRDRGFDAIASTDSVATPDGAAAIVAAALERWGRIDAIIHNAALTTYAPLTELTVADYERVRAVSLDGAVYLTLAAWPHMQQQHYGRFVFITSTAGLLGEPGYAAYAAAKTGMLGHARVIRAEGDSYNITANLLGVAAYTRMTAAMFADGHAEGDARLEDWWKRYMTPELVAPVATFLAHESCPANGEIFDTKGGHVERLFLASTPGYTDLHLTPEAVRDHWADITDERGYQIYQSPWDSGHAHSAAIVRAGAAPLPE